MDRRPRDFEQSRRRCRCNALRALVDAFGDRRAIAADLQCPCCPLAIVSPPVLAASPARTDTTASWAVPSKSPADRSAESPARWGFRRLGNDDDGAAASAAFAVTPNHAENEPSVARPRRASHRGGANDRKRSGFSDHGGCSGYVTLTEMEGPPSPPSPPEPPEPGSPLPLPEPPDSPDEPTPPEVKPPAPRPPSPPSPRD